MLRNNLKLPTQTKEFLNGQSMNVGYDEDLLTTINQFDIVIAWLEEMKGYDLVIFALRSTREQMLNFARARGIK